MTYIYNSTVANKIFSILGKEDLDNIINKYHGNYKVRYFDVESQIKLLIAINILSLNSLGDAVTQLGSCLPLSREINSSKGLLDIKRILASNFREIYSTSINNLLTRRSYNNFIV
ncbi:DUF4372 domain-containing protein [Romboutsia sp.]|uniref:DUF4372 domain-containing protein n=1 Tax=Romboutsia sp. TaxID=1965302 RepID=UPI003F2A9A3C